jgi:hypothetical protein
MTLADRIREYARQQFIQPARQSGQKTVRIIAGEVHKAMGLKARVPAVCHALASGEFLRTNHLALERRDGPPSGLGARAEFLYRLDQNRATQESDDDRFWKLRGIAKGVFPEPGGMEAYVLKMREHFYEPDEDGH